jgi:large subunit ribosomal protein L18
MAYSKARDRQIKRQRRHARVRKKIRGSAERPRLVVRRTLRHIEGQLVDDDSGITVIGISTRSPTIASVESESEGKIGLSFAAGRLLATQAVEAGIGKVVFDRGGYKYHGRVKAFADGARDGGLEF